jgi:hypothetical protein
MLEMRVVVPSHGTAYRNLAPADEGKLYPALQSGICSTRLRRVSKSRKDKRVSHSSRLRDSEGQSV